MRKFFLRLFLFLMSFSTLFAIEQDESMEVQELLVLMRPLPLERLRKMERAGKELQLWERRLQAGKSCVMRELFRGEKPFKKYTRYPTSDVFDRKTYSKYFFHSHREGESGHFHTFLYEKGMPEHMQPVAYEDKRHVAHLVAIAMDKHGAPSELFTINQWVTGEAWYSKEDTEKMLDSFQIGHTEPSWPLNRWVSNMLRLFYPQVVRILEDRDLTLAEWQENHPKENAFKSKELEVLSSCKVSLEKQLFALKLAIKEKQRPQLGKSN